MARPPSPAIDRFMDKVVALDDEDGGCWIWTGAKLPAGYGVFWLGPGQGQGYAHRFAHETFSGPIPEGHNVDHLCRNPSCCNPDHLEAVTFQANVLRGDTLAARKSLQTHCIHGHEFTSANTYLKTNGTRSCRECNRRRSAVRRRFGV